MFSDVVSDWPNFKFTWERERQGDKFYYVGLNLGAVPTLQLQLKKIPSFKVARPVFLQVHFSSLNLLYLNKLIPYCKNIITHILAID